MPTTTAVNKIDMEDLKIRFDGQTHQIEANTLITSLLHFTSVVQEINTELKTDRKIEIKINALSEGSFLIHFTLDATTILQQFGTMFSGGIHSAAANIIGEIGAVYGLYKWAANGIKSRKKQGDKVIVENSKGDTIIVNNTTINIYDNKSVQKSLSQEFSTLENDPNVTGFEILDKNDKPIVQIERSEFSILSSGFEELRTDNEHVINARVMLNIVRLSFDKSQKWEFYYEGNKITAKINDADFLAKIDSGESFAKGDSLQVDLEILQEFDATVNTRVNKSYKINKIVRHMPRPPQGKIEF